jgi:hypothetical protein
MDFQFIRASLRKPTTCICGVPVLVAMHLVFFLDTWFRSVQAKTTRYVAADVKNNPDSGTDNIIVANSHEVRERYSAFTAGVVQTLGDRLSAITLDDILASEELLCAFLFSVSGNVRPLKFFADWFKSLSDDDKDKLASAPDAVKAACTHVAWLQATCKHFISDAGYDPIVKLCSVKYHGDIPEFDELLSGEPADYLLNYIRLFETDNKSDNVDALMKVDLNKFALFTEFLIVNPEFSF